VHAYPERPAGRHPGWPARLGPLAVKAGEVACRPVRLRDGSAWSALRIRDQRHLAPWEPTLPGPWAQRNSTAEWPGRWLYLRSAGRRGVSLPFAVTLDGRFVGHVVVGNVVREPLLSAYVGYWVDRTVTGGGVITGAVALVVDHCFGPVGLHRIEATVRPENVASLRVLEKLGFREEGLFRRYLDVDGGWRDHFCFALTLEDLPAGGVTGRLLREGRAHLP
jgi:[ribosomal protein S5]-alanine N-acetyltransferase